MNFFSDKIKNFFESIAKYLDATEYNSFSWLFIIFMGIFALATIIVIFATFFSYEFTLTRAIDKINKFLSRNPRINEDNLVTFNNKMKERSVPKPLRRQWQQFMIYREHNASHYMSFKHCVENPLKTSTYNQQMGVYKRVSIILVCLSVLVGVFCGNPPTFVDFFQDNLIIPVFILVLYWLISMIMSLVHNATTADLYQNYQYFEINIDKATATLPEYVDYEVLFTPEEIKRGIPVLFEYIQKRAIEEQKELEKARIKNVEHEKFNFDESGLDASLVLERSMKEAEDYIATRKKFRQDIDQVNHEIAAIENQYKENVKENQKLMQTSKESVDGLKKQLEQATSTIEINYIKKQMKDEINRQQVAERDFDALTEKHNKEIKALQEEIKRIEGEIDGARKALETSMMSEFGTYSTKVYKLVEDRVNSDQKNVIESYENRIHELEERLSQKDDELDNVYSQYQTQLSELEEKSKNFDSMLKEKDDIISQVQGAIEGKSHKSKSKKRLQESEKELENYDYSQDNLTHNSEFEYVETPTDQVQDEFNYYENTTDEDNQGEQGMVVDAPEQSEFNYYDNPVEDFSYTEQPATDQEESFNYTDDNSSESFNYTDSAPAETFDYTTNSSEDFNYLNDETAYDRHTESLDKNEESFDYKSNEDESDKDELTFNYLSSDEPKVEEENLEEEKLEQEKVETEQEESSEKKLNDLFDKWLEDEESEEENKQEELSEDDKDVNDLNNLFEQWLATEDEKNSEDEQDSKDVEAKPVEQKRKAGRPRKSENKGKIDFDFLVNGEDEEKEEIKEEIVEAPKKAGRPKKAEAKEKIDFAFLVGTDDSEEEKEEKPVRRGRPRKVVETTPAPVVARRGRPRKEKVEEKSETAPKRRVGRPKKVSEPTKKRVGRPKKVETTTKKSVGRPKKANPVGRPRKPRPVGRPKKNAASSSKQVKRISEIDKKLNELNKQIKKENANIAKTKRQLANANIKKSKR